MFTSNPFADLTVFLSPRFMQVYVVLMVLAVLAGTLLDAWHKRSGEFFLKRRHTARAIAKRRIGGAQALALMAETVAEAAVSGEFCKWPRRASHLLMMYGFLIYVITTAIMVYGYTDATSTPAILPTLWTIGAAMIVVGGLWFFFFLRVNVAFDGDPPYHVGRADIFVLSLIGSAASGLIWQAVQAASGHTPVSLGWFAVYLLFTTVLFGSVFWSKFAHMFYKPVVAYQRRVEEADGSTDLPTPAFDHHCRN